MKKFCFSLLLLGIIIGGTNLSTRDIAEHCRVELVSNNV